MAKEPFEQFAMPDEVRAFVEQSVSQARTAFDGIAQAANQAVAQWKGQAEAARAGASEIAHKHGMTATFMPKPFANRAGSGAHFHVSIGSAKQKNAFYDKNDKSGMGLSTMAYHFLGGILKHARALCAVAAPTVNSYKRLVVGRALSGATWAPAYIAYGDNNRTACVRVPYGRLEIRLPDSGCNPYLVSAAIIAAGLDGIDKKLDPGPAQNINLYQLSPEELAAKGIKLLPQSLHEASRTKSQTSKVG